MEPELKNTKKEHDEYTGRILRIVLKPFVHLLTHHTSVTPNQITLTSIIPALLGIFFLRQGGYQYTLFGALSCFLYVLLDAVDGQLARERNQSSLLGKWFDGILGYILVPFMMLAAAIGLPQSSALIVGAIAALCFPIQFTLIYFFNSEIKRNNERIELPVSSKWRSWRYAYGLALFFPLLLFGALLNQVFYVLLFFATIGHLYWLVLLAVQYWTLKSEMNKGEVNESEMNKNK